MNINFIPAFLPFYTKKKRYKFSFGGRGGGKSVSIATILLLMAREKKLKILCTREIQKSINDSVHTLLKDIIERNKLVDYEVYAKEIRNNFSGSVFIFSGLREHTVSSIKSYQGINYCWVEEAQAVTPGSRDILTPTIREPESEIWFSYNRLFDSDDVHNLFVSQVNSEKKKRWKINGEEYHWTEYTGDSAIGLYINYYGNPFFPDVLRQEMETDRKNNYDLYLHKWEGLPQQQTDDCILDRKLVMQAVNRQASEWDNPSIGVDPARFGHDESVIAYRIGDVVYPLIAFRGKDTVRQAQEVINIVREIRRNKKVDPKTPILIRVDDTGVGAGVTDNLRQYSDDKQLNIQVIPIINNEQATTQKYKSYGDQMWGDLVKAFQTISIPSDTKLISQLTTRKYKIEPDGKIRLEKKEGMKKRGLGSPDRADALALCLATKHSGKFYDFSADIKSPITHGLMNKEF